MELYEIWTAKIVQEFFGQGDLEKSNGLTISPYFDRNNVRAQRFTRILTSRHSCQVHSLVSSTLSAYVIHNLKNN